MSESTLQTAAGPEPDFAEPLPPRRAQNLALLRRHPWIIGGACLVLFSFLLLRWAGTRPGYDPYGWLTWGYQTLHLNLDLGGAPSWKPLTWLFDVPFSLFGHVSLWLWMTTAVAAALAGAIFAGRLVWKLCALLGVGRRPALVAAAFSGACLLGIENYMHYVLSVQSDPMIATMCLAAIDCHLSDRPRWAMALAVLASLGRPEAWPFLGLYAIWAWRRVPSMRWLVVAGLALIPLLWFGVPTITNGRPLVAGQLALASPRELHGNKVLGTIHRFTALHLLPVELLALVAIGIAWLRRNRLLLILAGGAVVWVIVEIAFVLHGWPGVPRYLFEPAAITAVLAGVSVGWILHEGPLLLARRGLPAWATRRRLPAWGAAILVGLIVISLIPGAIARLRTEHKDLYHERFRTKTINRLQATVDAVGGSRRVRDCGRPVITVEFVSILAWMTDLNDGILGHRPAIELRQHHGSVLFTALHSGWSVRAVHLRGQRIAKCSTLKGSFLFTSHHPNGILTRYIQGPLF